MPAAFRWLDPILNPMACIPPPEATLSPPSEKAETLLRHLEERLRHRLRYALAGEKQSLMKGQGLDFADLRVYQPGDDIRKMDWSVFARTLTPHVREYQEEKQLTLWLAVDATPSMQFGQTQSKLAQAANLAGLFGLLAAQARHKLGGFFILGAKTEIIPPKAGYAQLQHILQRLLSVAERPLQPPGHLHSSGDPLPVASRQLARLVQKNATVLFLSDFLSLSEAWQSPLGQLSRQAQMIYLFIHDPLESALPPGLGLLPVVDPETGAIVELDTGDASFRAAYASEAEARQRNILDWLSKTGTAVAASTSREAVEILAELLKQGPHR
jgi:uncharacterized protein (DUF58 family)